MSRWRPPIQTNTQPPPFWHRPGDIARYPLRGDALLMLIVLVACGVLAWLPGLGWLLSIVVYFTGYKYAFEILLASADGRDDAPVIALHAQNGAVWRLLCLLLVLLLTVKLAFFGKADGIAWLALVVFALIQPSVLAMLATGSGLPNALNPANALRMIGRIGASYLVVSGTLFLIQSLVMLAARMLALAVPGFLATLAVDAVFYWGLFASFHLLGLEMYRHCDELGYTPSNHANALPAPRDRDQALLDQVDVRMDENDLLGAITLLHEDLRERSVGAEIHDRYRQLLRQAGDNDALEAHATTLLAILAQEKQDRRALALLREMLDARPTFALPVEYGERLVARALDLGQSQLAADALRALLRAGPRHPQAPQWALHAAQLLQHQLGAPADAATVLRSACETCREDAQRAKLEAALALLPTKDSP